MGSRLPFQSGNLSVLEVSLLELVSNSSKMNLHSIRMSLGKTNVSQAQPRYKVQADAKQELWPRSSHCWARGRAATVTEAAAVKPAACKRHFRFSLRCLQSFCQPFSGSSMAVRLTSLSSRHPPTQTNV